MKWRIDHACCWSVALSRIKIEIPRPPEEALRRTPPEVLAYIRSLEEAISRLVKALNEQGVAVEKLTEELRESKRQAAPFRRKKKKDKRRRKKPGRKGGHEQARRPEPEHVDHECHAEHPAGCDCGGTVVTVETYEQYQEDIEPRVVVRKIVTAIGECDTCHRRYEGWHPLKTSTARGNADRQIGPTALALAADLHYGQGVSFDKIREHLKHLGLEVETSTLVRAMERIAGRAEATFQELMNKVLEQAVLHIDETGWGVDGEPFYLWVISGPEATIYFVRKTRSSDEVADFLKDFAGVFVSDGAKAYDKLGKTLVRALCLLHLRRNAVALEEKQTKGAVRFPRALISWLDAAIELAGKRAQMEPQKYERKAKRLENKFLGLLETRATNKANARMLHRLEEWQDPGSGLE